METKPEVKKWIRNIPYRKYKFFKEFLQFLPLHELEQMYQDAVRRYENSKIDATTMKDDDFYKSSSWRRIRFKVLNFYRKKCVTCGRSSKEVPIHVDHIRPRWLYPELALELANLRVLCEDCNKGKAGKVPINKEVFKQKVIRRIKKS